MATTWLEAGTGATDDFTFWDLGVGTGPTGTVTSSTQAVLGSIRSIASNSGSGNDGGNATKGTTQVVADTGTRISFGFRYNGTLSPSNGGADFLVIATTGYVCVIAVGITSTGKLVLINNSGTALATGTTVLSANTDYRITLAYKITSTTVNTIQVYINGNIELNETNLTLSANDSAYILAGIGIINTAGANVTIYTAHYYVDNVTTGGDPGNIRVTAKRPFANGTTNGFTASGTPSGYGSGNASYVNLRPLQTATAHVAVTVAGSAITEEYNIEGQSVGDINITGSTIVDFMGWLYAKSSLSETDSIRLVGSNSNISLTSTVGLFTKIAGSTTYPPGTGSDIGMVTNATAATATLYDAGIIVAFIPAASGGVNLGPGFRSLLGVGF